MRMPCNELLHVIVVFQAQLGDTMPMFDSSLLNATAAEMVTYSSSIDRAPNHGRETQFTPASSASSLTGAPAAVITANRFDGEIAGTRAQGNCQMLHPEVPSP